jgi:hypothetical protein
MNLYFVPKNLAIKAEIMARLGNPKASNDLYEKSADLLDALLSKVPTPTVERQHVRLFKMFNFASCNVMMFVLGPVLFSSTVLLPQFLQTLMSYTAQTAGMVLSIAAILLVFLLPIVGRLAGHFQARYILAFGWITLAIAMYFFLYGEI